MGYSVAIDGPAGAGKSTIAKQIAKKMAFFYLAINRNKIVSIFHYDLKL